jgi:rhomboid protease GluP
MSDLGSLVSPIETPVASQGTFCTYLAKQFIAKKGFSTVTPPELAPLAAVCDRVLTFSDGMTFSILCLIDREAYPGNSFSLTIDDVQAVGEACLKYAGKIRRRQMPVLIKIIEVGPGSEDQQQRLAQFKRESLTAKVVPTVMIVDTASQEIWDSGKTLVSRGVYVKFVEKLLTAPREPDSALVPRIVAASERSFPILTTLIITVLIAVFAVEVQYGVSFGKDKLSPTIATLVALGGLSGSLVHQSGEWWRLLSAPFLHVNLGHLLMNAVGLFIAGRKLEHLVGPAWFGAIYVVSALCGAFASLALNAPTLITVGASGAIMGLFAAMLVLSYRFPPGAIRTDLLKNAVYVLIPSLLPLTNVAHGEKVDYAAHFGGAVGGAIVGLLVLKIWRDQDTTPRFVRYAMAAGIAGLMAFAYPILPLVDKYPTMAFAGQMIPADKTPTSAAAFNAQLATLSASYPRDPRVHLAAAGKLLDAQDFAGAAREARLGLAEETTWRSFFDERMGWNLRAILALATVKTDRQQAKQIARPVCEANKDGQYRAFLNSAKLCDP